MAEQATNVSLKLMEGSWIGDVRGTVVGSAYVETRVEADQLAFDIRINANGQISVFKGRLHQKNDGPQVAVLESSSADESTKTTGTLTFDLFSPERMNGRWILSNGAAGAVWLLRVNTQGAATSSAGTAGNLSQPNKPAELVSKEDTLPSLTLYRRDLEAIIERITNLVPSPNKPAITAGIDQRSVIQFSNEFLQRQDLPRFLHDMKISISDFGQPFAKSVSLVFAPTETKIFVQSDNATWTSGVHLELRSLLGRNISRIRTVYQKHGLVINSLIALSMIVVVPDLPILSRVAFVACVIAILAALFKLHGFAT